MSGPEPLREPPVYMKSMTTFDPAQHPRGHASNPGSFAAKVNTAPDEDVASSLVPPAVGPRIMMSVNYETWIRDYAVPTGDSVTFDATDLVLAHTAQGGVVQNGEVDHIWEEAIGKGLIPEHPGPFSVDVEDSYREFREEPRVAEFIDGNADDLSDAVLSAVSKTNALFPNLPNVAVHGTDDIDLLYNEEEPYSGVMMTTRVTIDSKGVVTGLGRGDSFTDDWTDDDFDFPAAGELRAAGLL